MDMRALGVERDIVVGGGGAGTRVVECLGARHAAGTGGERDIGQRHQNLDVVIVGEIAVHIGPDRHAQNHEVGFDAHFIVGDIFRLGDDGGRLNGGAVDGAGSITAAGGGIDQRAVPQIMV